jgi:hypothetical protein
MLAFMQSDLFETPAEIRLNMIHVGKSLQAAGS